MTRERQRGRGEGRGAEGQIGPQITKKENDKQPTEEKNYCSTTDSKQKKKLGEKEGTKGWLAISQTALRVGA